MKKTEIKAYLLECYWEEYQREMEGKASDFGVLCIMLNDVGYAPISPKGSAMEIDDAIAYWQECLQYERERMRNNEPNDYATMFMYMNDCGIAHF